MNTRIGRILVAVALFSFAPGFALAGVCFNVTGLPAPTAIDLAPLQPSAQGQVPLVGEVYGLCGGGQPPVPVQGAAIVGPNNAARLGLSFDAARLGCSDGKAEIVLSPPSYTTGNGLVRLPEGSVANVVVTHDPTGSACQTGAPRPGACVDNVTTLCLQQKRFAVTATQTVPGQVLRIGSEAGYFYFFDPSNVELTVKVLNGCPLNDRYWVVVSNSSNVQFSVRVTDTQTGFFKTYANTAGGPFAPVRDTGAFATCP